METLAYNTYNEILAVSNIIAIGLTIIGFFVNPQNVDKQKNK